MKKNREPFILMALGYLVLFIFLIAFVIMYSISNFAHISLGWSEISPTLVLILALFCSLPIFMPFIWERLTKLRFFEFEISLSDITADINEALPNELKDTKRLQLGTTLAPEILTQINSVLKNSAHSELIEVNLGYGRTWLVTRLYLLSALSDDYTEIKNIVFLEKTDGRDRSFIGMTSPKSIRGMLAAKFPILEKAYREAYLECISVSENQTISYTNEIEWIVQNFGIYLQRLSPGGEAELRSAGNKEWISKDTLNESLRFEGNDQSINWENDQTTPLLLYRIVKSTNQFVVLLQNQQLTKVIDRLELSSRIADLYLKQRLQ